MSIIKPTIGRVVWFYEPFVADVPEQAQAAIVTFVHSDTLVNLVVFDEVGNSHGVTSVPLRQPGEVAPGGIFCEWMPYQIGQAAKHVVLTEADAEADLAGEPRPDNPSFESSGPVSA